MTANPYQSPSAPTSRSRSRARPSDTGTRAVFLMTAIACFVGGAVLPTFQASGAGYSPRLDAVLRVVYPLERPMHQARFSEEASLAVNVAVVAAWSCLAGSVLSVTTRLIGLCFRRRST
jgi:hypothetical protein